MDMRCPLPCHLSRSRYTLVRFGKEKHPFSPELELPRKICFTPTPALVARLVPVCLGLSQLNVLCPPLNPGQTGMVGHPTITLFLEQLPAKSIPLPFLLLLVTKSCLTLVTPWTVACQAPLSRGFPSGEYWSGLPFPSPGDLPYSGIKSPALQVDSFLLSHLCCAESLSLVRLFATPWTAGDQAPQSMGILQARILEWVAMTSSRESSQPRNQTGVSCIAGRFFTSWATREALFKVYTHFIYQNYALQYLAHCQQLVYY